ncbi:MAG: fibronectin type III domain-containing protein [Ruminococcus bicirculans (ex Wegman et al. 2014)]
MNEYKGRDIMKNSVKRTTAAILATMMIGTGMYAPIADHYNLFSQTSITAEAASVGKVTGLKSNTLSNSEIKLKWSKVKGASGYTVYMRKNGKYNKVADTKSTTYTVKKLPNATRENFKVRAYKKVNGKKVYGSYSSNWNTATNPQPCKGLKVSSVNSDSIKLSWTKIGCTNYRVFQYISGEWKEIGKTTGTSYTIKKLTPQTEYQFKIRACKKDDKKKSNNHYGKYSGVVTATTKKSDKITQADIDAMKKELQEYSNSKADFIRENYTEFDGYGTEYNTVDEFFERCVRNYTPDNSSYSSVYIIPTDETDIEEVKKQLKNKIDYGYRRNEDVNFVVYIDNCPNGLDIYNGSCWAVYLLY